MMDALVGLWSDWIAGSNPWWIAILSGYVLLSIAVLILARMHWTQSRRFATCVVLSVFAHLLLVAALCLVGTSEHPGNVDGNDGIRVTLSPDQFFVHDDQLAVQGSDTSDPQEELDSSGGATSTADSLLANVEPEIPEAAATTDPSNAPEASQWEDSATGQPWDQSAGDDPSPAIGPVPQAEQTAENRQTVDDAPAENDGPQELVFDAAADVADGRKPADDSAAADRAGTHSGVEQPSVPQPGDALADELQVDAAAPHESAPAFASDIDKSVDLPPASKHSDAVAEPSVDGDTSVWKPADAGWADPGWAAGPAAANRAAAAPAADVHDSEEPSGSGGGTNRPYGLRSARGGSDLARRRGATPETEAAVRAALKWLAENQNRDGRWDAGRHGAGRGGPVDGHFRGGAGADADTGITGLALLAFLSAGDTHLSGVYREHVRHGLEFLMRSQRADGSLAGNARHYAQMYCHGMATLAMAEAYGMTHDQRLRPYVEAAIGYLARSQHPVTGGWRYTPGEPGDMSQFGWQVMALVAAERAGIPIAPAQRQLAERFLASVSRGQHGGLACYRPGEQLTASMTAEALACRVLLKGTRDQQALAEGAQLLARHLPSRGQVNLYYWYYGTLGLCQWGGPEWESWNRALQDRLLPLQRTDGAAAGSWDTNTVWGGHGGRVYTTAMATLCLEVYYRYAPPADVEELAREGFSAR